MLKPHKILLASTMIMFAHLAYGQASIAPGVVPTSTGDLAKFTTVMPELTDMAPAPVTAAPASGSAMSTVVVNANAATQFSADPYVQRRLTIKQAKAEYKAKQKLAKQEYKAEKQLADAKLKASLRPDSVKRDIDKTYMGS